MAFRFFNESCASTKKTPISFVQLLDENRILLATKDLEINILETKDKWAFNLATHSYDLNELVQCKPPPSSKVSKISFYKTEIGPLEEFLLIELDKGNCVYLVELTQNVEKAIPVELKYKQNIVSSTKRRYILKKCESDDGDYLSLSLFDTEFDKKMKPQRFEKQAFDVDKIDFSSTPPKLTDFVKNAIRSKSFTLWKNELLFVGCKGKLVIFKHQMLKIKQLQNPKYASDLLVMVQFLRDENEVIVSDRKGRFEIWRRESVSSIWKHYKNFSSWGPESGMFGACSLMCKTKESENEKQRVIVMHKEPSNHSNNKITFFIPDITEYFHLSVNVDKGFFKLVKVTDDQENDILLLLNQTEWYHLDAWYTTNAKNYNGTPSSRPGVEVHKKLISDLDQWCTDNKIVPLPQNNDQQIQTINSHSRWSDFCKLQKFLDVQSFTDLKASEWSRSYIIQKNGYKKGTLMKDREIVSSDEKCDYVKEYRCAECFCQNSNSLILGYDGAFASFLWEDA